MMMSVNYGYKFIVFCKDNSLSILNGRLDGSSKVTCKNVSTVDYFLCSKMSCLLLQIYMFTIFVICYLTYIVQFHCFLIFLREE